MRYKRIVKLLRFLYRFKKSSTDNFVTDGMERCIICGKQTEISASTHIELRECYIAGCGQLCLACYKNLRNTNEKGNRLLSDKQLFMLIEESRTKIKK